MGFCNFGSKPAELKYDHFARLGVTGRQQVRDLWRQQDLASVTVGRDALPLVIPTHGIVLLELSGERPRTEPPDDSSATRREN